MLCGSDHSRRISPTSGIATTVSTFFCLIAQARRDIRGGRLATDRRTTANFGSGQAFTALAYSADGAIVIAGGTSKWVCVYDAEVYVLLRRCAQR
jgi:hypothetical protein